MTISLGIVTIDVLSTFPSPWKSTAECERVEGRKQSQENASYVHIMLLKFLYVIPARFIYHPVSVTLTASKAFRLPEAATKHEQGPVMTSL